MTTSTKVNIMRHNDCWDPPEPPDDDGPSEQDLSPVIRAPQHEGHHGQHHEVCTAGEVSHLDNICSQSQHKLMFTKYHSELTSVNSEAAVFVSPCQTCRCRPPGRRRTAWPL